MEFFEHRHFPLTPEKDLFNAYTTAKNAGLNYIRNLPNLNIKDILNVQD